MPEPDEFPGAKRCTSLDDGIRGADVIMALRIQNERMDSDADPGRRRVLQEWGITERQHPARERRTRSCCTRAR